MAGWIVSRDIDLREPGKQKKGKALKIQTADEIRYKITTKQRDMTLKELDPTLNFEQDETTEIHQD